MPWAIFHRQFNFDFRPARAVCITVKPKPVPQQFPGPIIDAAVKAGAAERAKSPTAQQKRAFQRAPGGNTPIT
ncbi:hypothetical protein GRZ55_11585 [Chelativorans sp. ZYF759]|uniref:hypothetical protein n=1 Tax=Chelativorans sp. ZYF759 TaxID=2692213 RepID=UPI00145ED41F|nr:hypothetical protein [Chelativorans sp. ZYF759]NMG39885.1 hypothetical protein [Chelativorans sp. ZYF759]